MVTKPLSSDPEGDEEGSVGEVRLPQPGQGKKEVKERYTDVLQKKGDSAMKVTKQLKGLVDKQKKGGLSLRDAGILDHKEFGPYVDHFARNHPTFDPDNNPQAEWHFDRLETGSNREVIVYFKHASGNTSRTVVLSEDEVLKDLYNAEAD